VACRQTGAKRGLVRIVRTPAGQVAIDATGRLPGRGAYLCAHRSCWELALKRKALDRALKVTIDDSAMELLAAYARDLPDDGPGGIADDDSTVGGDTGGANQDE